MRPRERIRRKSWKLCDNSPGELTTTAAELVEEEGPEDLIMTTEVLSEEKE